MSKRPPKGSLAGLIPGFPDPGEVEPPAPISDAQPKRRLPRTIPDAERVIRDTIADYHYVITAATSALNAAWEAGSQADVRGALKLIIDARSRLVAAYKDAEILSVAPQADDNTHPEAAALLVAAQELIAAQHRLDANPPTVNASGVLGAPPEEGPSEAAHGLEDQDPIDEP